MTPPILRTIEFIEGEELPLSEALAKHCA